MTALEPAQPGALLPMDPGSARRAMDTYQQLCEAVLTPADVIGRPGHPGGFVKRSGWSKLATFYGASTEIIHQHVDRDPAGAPVRATALARATASNGRHADGDGACALTEPRFRTSQGRIKAEHDLMATAVTRATNRAISNLIGFGSVSAEEAEATTADPHRPYGPEADEHIQDTVLRALEVLQVHPDAIRNLIADADGYLPRIAARAMLHAAANRLKPDQPDQPETAAETSETTTVPNPQDTQTSPDPE